MRKNLKVLFFIFAVICCVQLIGLEEAFCDDSILEAGCQDCLTCAGHQFAGLSGFESLPVITVSGYSTQNYSFRASENPPLLLFRPPISR